MDDENYCITILHQAHTGQAITLASGGSGHDFTCRVYMLFHEDIAAVIVTAYARNFLTSQQYETVRGREWANKAQALVRLETQ